MSTLPRFASLTDSFVEKIFAEDSRLALTLCEVFQRHANEIGVSTEYDRKVYARIAWKVWYAAITGGSQDDMEENIAIRFRQSVRDRYNPCFRHEVKVEPIHRVSRFTNLLTAEQRRARYFEELALCCPTFQSGLPDGPSRRAARDAAQRKAAADKREEARKKVPKRDREQHVKNARDKRNPVFQAGGITKPLVSGLCGAAATVFVRKLFTLLKKGENAVDKANALLGIMISFKKSMKKVIGGLFWSFPVVIATYFIVHTQGGVTDSAKSLLVTALTGLLGVKLWPHVCEFFQSADDGSFGQGCTVEFQSGTQGVVSKLIATVMAFSIFKGKHSHHTVTEFTKRIALLDKVSMGWELFMGWALNAFESVFNYARRLCGKERVEFVKKTHAPMHDWARRVDKMAIRGPVEREQVTPETINEMVALIREGAAFKEIYRGTSMSRVVDEIMVKCSNMLQPYEGAINAKNNFRIEPEFLLFTGAPGIGKTLITVPLCTAIMFLSGLIKPDTPTDDVLSNIWSKGTSEFWNGYSTQKSIIFDDIFQARPDATDKENEYITIIRAVSSWALPLNFADLASKGKIYFNSPLLIGTCNNASISAAARLVLHEPEAVMRRIAHPYRMVVKPEFMKNGRLDHLKYEEEYKACRDKPGVDGFPWHIWQVHVHNFDTGRTEEQSMPMKELVLKVAMSLRRKIEAHGDGEARNRAFAEAIRVSLAATSEDGCSSSDVGPASVVSQPVLQGGLGFLGGLFKPVGKLAVDCMENSKKVSIGLAKHLLELETGRDRLRTFLLCGLGTVAGVLSLKFFLKLMKDCLMRVWDTVVEFFGFTPQKKKGKPRLQSNAALTRAKNRGEATFQIGDAIPTNIYSNSYKAIIDTAVGPCVLGQILFVCDNLAVQPRHFTTQVEERIKRDLIKKTDTLRLTHVSNPAHSVAMTVERYLAYRRMSLDEKEVEFLRFDNVRAHRNLVGNFMTEKQLNYLSGVRGRLEVCNTTVEKGHNDPTPRTCVLPAMKFGKNLAVAGKRIDRYVEYQATTNVGHCGAPVCVFDDSSFSGRSCLGIHVAGELFRAVGYGAIVTKEMIDKALEVLDVVFDDFAADLTRRGIVMQSGDMHPFENLGSFLPIGVVDKPVILCPKTSYYVTPLFGEFGPYDCLPAPLSECYRGEELVYPMLNAVAPYSTPVLLYDVKELGHACHVGMSRLSENTRNCSRRLYTFEEAILGIAEEKFRSIPRNTAAGYPYCLSVSGGKREFFGEGDVYDLTTPLCVQLRERVDFVESQAKLGIRCAHVFVDFLKDELRPKKKVIAAATRLISSAPLDYVVLWRKYFGAFSAAFMRNHTYSGMAPGICSYTDWTALGNLLRSKGERVFAGDFKAFDSSEQPDAMVVILDYINKWYDDGLENARVRQVLWLDLMHSRHIGGRGRDQRYIYQWNKSLPSGHPFTTILNSMYSLMMLAACYIRITGDLIGFWRHVFAITYGDDNVLNVDDETSEVYNQVSVASCMHEAFGLVYTSDLKEGALEPFTSISGVSFLKRRFLLEDNWWLCPLELDSFLYAPYWCKNKRLEHKIRIDELENSLEELSLHGQHTWDQHAPHVYEVLQRYKPVPNASCDRDVYLRIVRSRADNWY